ncbi:MAG: hypothetical protein H0Z40_06000 [Desulfotomaculum sp.]|nr:hypothetical protein [Desulfotomaculum sp.]
MVLQLIIDTGADILGIYEVSSIVKIGGGSAFFTLGTVFTMGVLFVQFLPTNHWLKAAHIIATATLFLGLEYLFVQRSLVNYTH